MPTTLICTLGMSSPVISETLLKLGERGVQVDNLVILHTTDDRVFKNKTPRGTEIGLEGLETSFLKQKYPGLRTKRVPLTGKDIRTPKDNQELMRLMVDTISSEKQAGNTVLVSIAGGRKTMSAVALFAAYLIGCDGIFHVLVNGDDMEVSDEWGYEPPLELLSLVEVPLIDLSPLLGTVLLSIEQAGKNEKQFANYLQSDKDLKAFTYKFNDIVRERAEELKLKEVYEKRREKYEQMCFVVESILRARTKEVGLMPPEFQRRVKTFEAFLGKIQEKRDNGEPIKEPFADIEDIAGSRANCLFEEDVEAICSLIEDGGDFDVCSKTQIESTAIKRFKRVGTLLGEGGWQEEPEEKKRIGYNATHYIVKLTPARTQHIEYRNLRDIKCEIQVKTIQDHAWAQVDHRLRYKSDEYKKRMDQDTIDKVDDVFVRAFGDLRNAKEKFSKLRQYYPSLSRNREGE